MRCRVFSIRDQATRGIVNKFVSGFAFIINLCTFANPYSGIFVNID